MVISSAIHQTDSDCEKLAVNWTLTCITKIDTRHPYNEHRVFFWHKWRQSDVTGARTSGVCLSLTFLLTFQWAMMRRFQRVLVITVNKQTTVHHQFLVFERASFRPRQQRALYYILSVHLYSMCLCPLLTHVCARPGSAPHSRHRCWPHGATHSLTHHVSAQAWRYPDKLTIFINASR